MKEARFYLKIDEQIEGPFSQDYLDFLKSQGKITERHFIKLEGSEEWIKPVIEIKADQGSNTKAALILTLIIIAISVAYGLFERYLVYKHHTNVGKLILEKIGLL